MAQARLTRAEQQQRTRERLLKSAEELFTTNGIERSTIEQIAANAGLTTGAIYSNFRDKAELVIAVWQQATARAKENRQRVLGGKSWTLFELFRFWGRANIEDLRAGIDKWNDWIPLDREFALFASRNDALRKLMAEQYEQSANANGAGLEEAAASEGYRLSIPGRDLMTLVGALSRGLLDQWHTNPKSVTPELAENAFAKLLEAHLEKATAPNPRKTTAKWRPERVPFTQ